MEGQEVSGKPEKARQMRVLGLGLLAFAVSMWIAAPAVFLLPLQMAQKLWTATALAVLGEGAFWISALLLGREVVRRYRRFLDPRPWLRRRLGRKS